MGVFDGFEKIVRRDEPLAMHTWFQLGGAAEFFAEPRNQDELIGLIFRCAQEEIPARVLGGGSNILVRDEGVPGMVLRLASPTFAAIDIHAAALKAGSGAPLGRVVTSACHSGLAGLESLIGIPGTLGGALHGNAGTHAGDVGQWTAKATVITNTGEVIERTRDEMYFSYRSSSLDDLVILEAVFQLDEDDPADLARRMQKNWILKRQSQPMGHQSAGCVFKNPRGTSAAELIEEAGLKGTRIGGAVVSDRHANFIVAEPECTAHDVIRLIDLIRGQVHDRLDVELERELEIW